MRCQEIKNEDSPGILTSIVVAEMPFSKRDHLGWITLAETKNQHWLVPLTKVRLPIPSPPSPTRASFMPPAPEGIIRTHRNRRDQGASHAVVRLAPTFSDATWVKISISQPTNRLWESPPDMLTAILNTMGYERGATSFLLRVLGHSGE